MRISGRRLSRIFRRAWFFTLALILTALWICTPWFRLFQPPSFLPSSAVMLPVLASSYGWFFEDSFRARRFREEPFHLFFVQRSLFLWFVDFLSYFCVSMGSTGIVLELTTQPPLELAFSFFSSRGCPGSGFLFLPRRCHGPNYGVEIIEVFNLINSCSFLTSARVFVLFYVSGLFLSGLWRLVLAGVLGPTSDVSALTHIPL